MNSQARNLPLISIIVPVYNSEKYIADTVSSCLTQTYKNIELILINDGSTDNTEQVIAQFLSDDRVKYFSIENAGACEARNFGINQAKGELYQFLDHDDLLDAEKLSYQLKCYEDNGDDYVYSGTMGTVSGTIKTLDNGYELYQKDFSPQQYFETLLNQFGKHITTGAWLLPVKLVKSTYGWDNRAGLNDDGEYFMRIILNAKGIKFCKGAIFYFRRDVPNSLSKQFDTREVYVKWLFSYTSYVKNFLQKLAQPAAGKLAWKALSVYYCSSYPNYPDLLRQCKRQMKELGYKGPSPHGGDLFMKMSKCIGVENSLRVLSFKKKLLK
jgi:glycosyltransferase involved in cell wall biosynthesis